MKYRHFLVCAIACICTTANAAITDVDTAVRAARTDCIGISAGLTDMKQMAGISTAVSGVGLATGTGAVVAGVAKSKKDAAAEEINMSIEDLRRQRDGITDTSTALRLSPELQEYRSEFIEFYTARIKSEIDAAITELETQHDELSEKSKTLGNVRTGLTAGTTAANVGGIVLAQQSSDMTDLATRIGKCAGTIESINDWRIRARMNGTDVSRLDVIVDACDGYNALDLNKISKLIKGAQVSSIVGTATGVAGLATSIAANTARVRDTNNDDGSDTKKEKNLNVAANILSGGAAVASGVATGFSASQIKLIQQLADTADKCEGVLK